jgi:hypothetical protein
MREKQVEKGFVDQIDDLGGKALKFVSPGMAGVPDRLVLMPVPAEHRELVARYVRFAEVKGVNGKLSKAQRAMHKNLGELGFHVELVSPTGRKATPPKKFLA